jgi:hypothetical protein
MSPEQLNGETVDGRSDLFSLGVVLYTVLTGYRPFQGNSAMTVSFKVVNRDPVPASVLDTELPPGLDYIIGRAMAKDPAERYQRGMEMALDIQDLRDGRELWSKAKQPGSLVGTAQQTADRVRSLGLGQGKSSAPGRARQSRHGSGPVGRLVDEVRSKKSLAALLLLVGLAVLGMRLGPMIRSKKLPPRSPTASRSVPPVPLIGEDATPKTAPSAPAPTTTIATVSPAVSKKSLKSPKNRGTGTPASVKTAGPVLQAAGATPEPATLDIEIEHKFAEAQLSIWVDSHLTYTHALEGTNKKRLVVFHSVQGHEFHAVEIPAGNHQLRVRVTSDANSVDKSATVAGKFAGGKEKLLKIHFDKQGEMNLSLE